MANIGREEQIQSDEGGCLRSEEKDADNWTKEDNKDQKRRTNMMVQRRTTGI